MNRTCARTLLAAALAATSVLSWSDVARAATPVKATIRKSVLTVIGSAASETIVLRLQSTDPNTLEVDAGGDGSADYRLDRRRFTSIVVSARSGDDTIVADRSNGSFTDTEATTFEGEEGNDRLLGANGGEHLVGGAGDDFLDGNLGADSIAGGEGADVVQWDPGDASDTVVGGGGVDQLVFNASNVSETFDLVAVGDHARLLRNVGAVTLDLDELEAIDLRALGGADVITVGDLTGTDVTTITTDLTAVGGGDDAQPDSIVVPPGVVVGQDGTSAIIDGVSARVRVVGGGIGDAIRITGATAADVVFVAGTALADTVAVVADGVEAVVQGATATLSVRLTGIETLATDLAGGEDHFATAGNVAALIGLTISGGDGNDTILGGNGADLIDGGVGDDFLDGNMGVDSIAGGEGADVVQWDPGDASDTVVGGGGVDRLVFNASNASETLDLVAVGDHARLLRNVGAVTLDLDEVETIDLRALGGADVISVGDLTGTDIGTINTDLAAVGGADDAQPDSIVVPPGVVVGQDSTAAVVDGLGARLRVPGGGAGDAIRITGATAADSVFVVGTASADALTVVADGVDAVVQGATATLSVRLTGIETLATDLAGGEDHFATAGNVAALIGLNISGGDGNDTILGGNGADLIDGGAGDDFLDGNMGVDSITGGDGADVVQWDPGDASDTVVGGGGVDRLVFNASNASETLDLVAVGDHARLLRNVGAVTLDLNELEAIDLRVLGGTDVITVGDLTGTDVASITTDLAAVGATTDAVGDRVVVNGTAGADQIAVVDDGSTVKAQGLTAIVRIAHADPTLDQLVVNGLDGDDTITATQAAAALMLLELLP